MSRATELAEAEAAKAEAEDETTETGDEPENPDAEPVEPIEPDEDEAHEEESPTPPSSLKVAQDQDKALDAESKRHAKALAKILGEHWADFAMCPLCQVDGYAVAYQPGEVGPEQREAVMTVLGESGLARFRQHPTEIRCEECDGWGEMLNGSRRGEQATSACQKCMGTGHVTKPFENVVQPPQWQPAPQPMQVAVPDLPGLALDHWGRPPGAERYGQDPALNGGLW